MIRRGDNHGIDVVAIKQMTKIFESGNLFLGQSELRGHEKDRTRRRPLSALHRVVRGRFATVPDPFHRNRSIRRGFGHWPQERASYSMPSKLRREDLRK